MPSKTYFNLDATKQEILEKSAVDEFSNYMYHQASINRIIQKINMPRGTFYLYFKNKEDLYLYIIEKKHTILLELFKDIVIKCEGDLSLSFKELFITIINYGNENSYSKLFKSFIVGLNHNIENKIIHNVLNSKNKDIINVIFEIFKKRYHHEIDVYIDMYFSLLIHSLTCYYMFNDNLIEVKKRYYRELEILNKGINI